MAAKKVGELVKEARTAAGLTQEKLAKTAGEKLTAADISKCERGEADLTAAHGAVVAGKGQGQGSPEAAAQSSQSRESRRRLPT